MGRYTVRRLLLLIPVLLGVSLIVHFSIRLVPGDTVLALVGEESYASPETLQRLREELGLDRHPVVQYGVWIGRVFQGDLGTAAFGNTPVLDQIFRALPVSIELGLMAIIIGMLVSIPIGMLSAIRADTWVDYVGRLFAIAGLSVPNFIVGTVIIVLPAIWFDWIPPIVYTPFTEDPLNNIKQFILPAFAVGFQLTGTVARMTRSSMLEVLRQDYIRTAWSKGLRERVVIVRHALKNAMIGPITIIGAQVGILVGGTVIIEQIFGLPGMGRLTLLSINTRDYTQLQGNILFIATGIVLVNLLVDLSYAWLDPRIRYG